MSTSGSYDNKATMYTIISDALCFVNVIDEHEPIPSDKWGFCKRIFNELMSFISIHEALHLTEDVTVTLTPGTASYTIGVGETIDSPKPMHVSDARNIVSSSAEVPMFVDSRADYLATPNKTQQGSPNRVYYKPGVDTGTLYVWPTGTTSTKTIIITTHRPIQDFDATGNNPDFPKEWVLPITYVLAVVYGHRYRNGKVPKEIVNAASGYTAALLGHDAEKLSIFFQAR
jgi:hypothetical protein